MYEYTSVDVGMRLCVRVNLRLCMHLCTLKYFNSCSYNWPFKPSSQTGPQGMKNDKKVLKKTNKHKDKLISTTHA